MANQVVHVEIIGPDPDVLRRFYRELFGWDAPAGAPVAPAISDTTEYSFIEPKPGAIGPAGGIGGGADFDAHTVFYVGVDDVGEALARAVVLGGEIALAPQRNEGTGVTVGHFRDPAGNLVGVAGPR
ncbi:MAG: glyoxalase/bleomycin resistance protein/dioxygenase [Microbacteriaceae bacterium]|nr:glyoxalase/bleomycin resistance protein/dioxygenase [Microbacteriaceae bacterium]